TYILVSQRTMSKQQEKGEQAHNEEQPSTGQRWAGTGESHCFLVKSFCAAPQERFTSGFAVAVLTAEVTQHRDKRFKLAAAVFARNGKSEIRLVIRVADLARINFSRKQFLAQPACLRGGFWKN